MKKGAPEPGPETGGWAIPYGDFLTLMLAVFIAMYAVSQVNTAKYHALAESLSRAFHGSTAVIQPVPPTQGPRAVPSRHLSPVIAHPISLIPVPVPPRNLPIPGHEGAAAVATPGASVAAADVVLQEISRDIARALRPWVESGAVKIHEARSWLAITINADVLFPEGAAQLSPKSRSTLQGVATVLGRFRNPVRIEGYTDNLPIHTARFPSNWELSASRAASVARLFSAAGVAPARLGIVGWGEYRPVASNATVAGRARNRRIVVVVLANDLLPKLKSLQAGSDSTAIAATWEPLPVDAPVDVSSNEHDAPAGGVRAGAVGTSGLPGHARISPEPLKQE